MSLEVKIFLWLVKRNRILTKKKLAKREWYTAHVFCVAFEYIHHLFVTCPLIRQIWIWIADYNNFYFQGEQLDDLWDLDACIPLKDSISIEMIRGAILWSMWLENKICFQDYIGKVRLTCF